MSRERKVDRFNFPGDPPKEEKTFTLEDVERKIKERPPFGEVSEVVLTIRKGKIIRITTRISELPE